MRDVVNDRRAVATTAAMAAAVLMLGGCVLPNTANDVEGPAMTADMGGQDGAGGQGGEAGQGGEGGQGGEAGQGGQGGEAGQGGQGGEAGQGGQGGQGGEAGQGGAGGQGGEGGMIEPPPSDREGWTLVWSDEFDAPEGTPIDPTKWVHDIGGHGWGNQQLEFDTDRVENSAHDGQGNLVITARQERFGDNDYTSARIKTQGRYSKAYGRFEARIQLPIGQGIWPAFWLLGDNITEVSWPQCGEIDVMEFRGQQPDESTGAIHGPGHSAGNAIWAGRRNPTPLPNGFHVFAVEWDPGRIVWSVDGDVFHEVTPDSLPRGAQWVYDHPFFIILNVAVGGTYLGPPDASTRFPQRMLVDYVRVYERDGDAPEPPPGAGLPLTVDDRFAASGYMGDAAQGGVDALECPQRGAPDAVGICHGFRWNARGDGWGGVYWQSPAGNWGELPGQPIPEGATEISFLAWGAEGGERVSFIAGYADTDGFGVETGTVELTPEPTRYSISLEGVTYDDVRAGFGWVTGEGAESPLTFYVDDIQWR